MVSGGVRQRSLLWRGGPVRTPGGGEGVRLTQGADSGVPAGPHAGRVLDVTPQARGAGSVTGAHSIQEGAVARGGQSR